MKKIKLELTEKEFNAMMQMLQDNAIMIGTADDEFCIPTKKHLKIFNKALKRNGINEALNF